MAALETSLVEWKLLSPVVVEAQGLSLGNFLSGMETLFKGGEGNLLHSLETSLVEWKRRLGGLRLLRRIRLGNFLSGMETPMLFLPPSFASRPWKLP